MAIELRQSLLLSQQLIMTPQLQQAIKLLQLSRLELLDTISQEMEQNPILEEQPMGSAEEDSRTADSKSEREQETPDLKEVTVEEIAELTDTINYEVITRLPMALPRLYLHKQTMPE